MTTTKKSDLHVPGNIMKNLPWQSFLANTGFHPTTRPWNMVLFQSKLQVPKAPQKNLDNQNHYLGAYPWLVGGWTNPSEKYGRQIGSFPQVGGWQ